NTSPEAGAPLAYPFGRFATVNYSSPLSSRLLLEAGAAQHGENWQYRDRWPDGPSYRSLIGVTEQSSGLAYRGGQTAGGVNFLGVYGDSSTSIWQFRASLSYITGAHAFKVG